MRFHHIGYAIADIPSFLETFFRPMFSPISVSEITQDQIQRVAVCFAEMPGGVTIELIQPLGEDSPLNSVLQQRRGGLYHLCYEVDDLDAEIARFRKNRCLILGKPVPAAAFHGRRIVFLLTPQKDIIEFVESPT